MLRWMLEAVVTGAILTSAAGAQGTVLGTSSAGTSEPSPIVSNGGLLHSLAAAPVLGQPYTAVQVTRSRQTLADGTTIAHGGHHAVARDNEGRVRVEHPLTAAHDTQPEIILVFVTNPVAHTLTTWVTGGPGPKIASVVKLPSRTAHPPEAQWPRPEPSSGRPAAIVTTEDLGTDAIEGQPVTVVKTTTILPPGRSGNDAPITKTHQVWTSSGLQLVLKEQWRDPRTGERTVTLEKLSRADPDPALFHAPPGYAVKDAVESLKELEAKLAETQQD